MNDDTQPEVTITVAFRTEADACGLAQFLKRAGLSDYRALAENEAEAYAMLRASERVRAALASAGFAPR
jgi:hypothetical protein